MVIIVFVVCCCCCFSGLMKSSVVNAASFVHVCKISERMI